LFYINLVYFCFLRDKTILNVYGNFKVMEINKMYLIKGAASKEDEIYSEMKTRFLNLFSGNIQSDRGSLGYINEELLYKIRCRYLFQKTGKDLEINLTVETKESKYFFIYLIISAALTFWTVIGLILGPLILWFMKENQAKNAEKEAMDKLYGLLRNVANKFELKIE